MRSNINSLNALVHSIDFLMNHSIAMLDGAIFLRSFAYFIYAVIIFFCAGGARLELAQRSEYQNELDKNTKTCECRVFRKISSILLQKDNSLYWTMQCLSLGFIYMNRLFNDDQTHDCKHQHTQKLTCLLRKVWPNERIKHTNQAMNDFCVCFLFNDESNKPGQYY